MEKKLSITQKKILNRYPETTSFEYLPVDVQKQLHKLRNFEKLPSEATKYLIDKNLEMIYGK